MVSWLLGTWQGNLTLGLGFLLLTISLIILILLNKIKDRKDASSEESA